MKKIIVLIMSLVVIILITGMLGGSCYFSSQLLQPRKKECPKKHFLYCHDPSELGLRFQDVVFRSPDGFTLRGWLMPSGKSSKAVIMVHGHGATRHEGLRWATALHRAGFNVLTFDLRNHGTSDPSITTFGYFEKRDVKAAVDFLIETKGMERVGVFGVSMGAATSISAMAEDTRIAAGVFEASFANLGDLLAEIAQRDYHLPRYPLLPLVLWFYEMRSGIDADELNPEEIIGTISPRPVFIIHCTGDNYIIYRHGERMFRAAGEPKEMLTAGCNIHAEAWQSDTEAAEARVVAFFKRYL